MEDLVNTVLLCSIWCDGGGRDFGSEFKSLLSPSYLTWGRSLLSLLPISKMKVVRVEWKPLAQSLPPNRCSVNTGLGSPASTCSDITTHLDICPRHCPFCVCPALGGEGWQERRPESAERRKQHTLGVGNSIARGGSNPDSSQVGVNGDQGSVKGTTAPPTTEAGPRL